MKVVIHTHQERYPCIQLDSDPEELATYPERTYEVPQYLVVEYNKVQRQLQNLETRLMQAAGFKYEDGGWKQ